MYIDYVTGTNHGRREHIRRDVVWTATTPSDAMGEARRRGTAATIAGAGIDGRGVVVSARY